MAELETKTREEFDLLYPNLKGKAVTWGPFLAAMDCSVQAIKMLRERVDQLEAGARKAEVSFRGLEARSAKREG